MADDAESNEPRAADVAAADSVVRDDVAVTLMGNLLEKLRILRYEQELSKKKKITPLTETHFAVLSFKEPPQQFQSFLELVTFLMKQCNQDFVVDRYDDPNSSVNKVILALKVLGFPLDFPASKLKLGYGEAVCAALDFMCDKALSARNFAWPRPAYPKEEFADEAEVDEDAEVEASDDLPTASEDTEETYSDLVSRAAVEQSALEESFQQMIVSDVDPSLWRAELERVGGKLKVVAKEDDGREWHAHIERTRKHESNVRESLPRVTAQLKAIASQLGDAIERMSIKEKQLNSQSEVAATQQQYVDVRGKLQAVSTRSQSEADKVNAMTNEHAEIAERLRETKAVMDERGRKMTDTTPLVAIKEALKTLAAEIKTFDLRIGVVGHALLQAKARQVASGLRRKKDEFYQDPEFDQSDDDSN